MKLLPWDWDLDVQMHSETLTNMGERFNQTLHTYAPPDGSAKKEYFLDVNQWIWQRTPGDGMNIIDARWIDVATGLFIDITGVSETDPYGHPGLFAAKNLQHQYKREEIWPLRESKFEGEKALLPYNYDNMLATEYQSKALVATEYEGRVWSGAARKRTCKQLADLCYSHRWNIKTKSWELARDVPSGKKGENTHNKLRVPGKYSTVETGGFFYSIYRLFNWWS